MLFNKKHFVTKLLISTMIMASLMCGCSDKDAKNHEYYHGVDGYYSLIDEGYGVPVKKTSEKANWINSASVSMQSSYKMRYGKDNKFDSEGILKAVQGPYKEEGYLIRDGAKGEELGGKEWQIIETLANGVGGCILSEACDYSDSSVEVVKQAISTNGAMTATIDFSASALIGKHDGYTTYNNPYPDRCDYNVVIVGWDDNFPKNYFAKPAAKDGAWLVQSFLGDSWGNEGCFWVSYETPMEQQTIFKVSSDFVNVIGYDGGCENTISLGESTTLGNVFHNAGLIRGVGTYTTEPDQMITINIYDGEFRKLIYSQDVTFSIPGYHTVTLTKELDLRDFSVAITYYGDAPVEGEAWEDIDYNYIVGIDEGQSFAYISGGWHDMAYVSTVRAIRSDFIPNNACIKVLY